MRNEIRIKNNRKVNSFLNLFELEDHLAYVETFFQTINMVNKQTYCKTPVPFNYNLKIVVYFI